MSPELRKSRTDILWWVFAFVWFAVWHYVHTWQVWIDPVRRVPGPIGDNTVMLWNIGWVRHAISHGSPGFWFPTAYYPEGFMFLFGTHTWLDGFLGWLMSPVLPDGFGGSILWANITLALATISSGLLTVAALKAWGINRWPLLLLLASAVTFSWFRMFALRGHYHFYGTHWMLLSLTLLSYARVSFQHGPYGKAIKLTGAAGLCLGLSFLNDQTMAVFGGILGTLILISIRLLKGQSGSWRRIVKPLVLYYGLALTVAAVHLVPIALAAFDGSLHYSVNLETPRLVDASSMVIPPPMHWLGEAIEGYRDDHGLQWSEGTYLGVVQLLLLGLLTFTALKYIINKSGERPAQLRPVFYLAVAAWGFLVIALGDTFIIGREHYNAMPGRLLKSLPLINNIRLPQRWVWPAHLSIALGGGYAACQLLSRFNRKWLTAVIFLMAVIPPLEAISWPLVPPVDFRNDHILRPPGLIESVQNQYKGGGVFLMPVEVAYAHSNLLQFQWGYEIPITIAYTARMPFTVQSLPWQGKQWTPEARQWLKDKQVQIIVFPFHDGNVDEFQGWLDEAKRAVPGLIALNRYGESI